MKRHYAEKTEIQNALQHIDVDAELRKMSVSQNGGDVDAEIATVAHAVLINGKDRMRHTWKDLTKFNSKATLSQDDFAAGLRTMGVSLQARQVEQLYKRFNKSNDGQLTYSEFVRMATYNAKESGDRRDGGERRNPRVKSSRSYSAPGSRYASRRASSPQAAAASEPAPAEESAQAQEQPRAQEQPQPQAHGEESENPSEPDREMSV
jgi:hypothetical protein